MGDFEATSESVKERLDDALRAEAGELSINGTEEALEAWLEAKTGQSYANRISALVEQCKRHTRRRLWP